MTIAAEKAIDGRQARSARTRAAVAQAMLDCIHDGTLRPSAKRVAARAGVSARAIFRHFENMESLMAETTRLHLEKVIPLMPPLVTTGSLNKRVRGFVEHCVAYLEPSRFVWSSGRLCMPFSPVLQEGHRDLLAALDHELKKSFAPEFKAMTPTIRKRRIQILTTTLNHDAWSELREVRGLSLEESKRTLDEAIRLLLTP
jgi:TetR/AcrR family transcriptional regulator of autoinduction and epiphytic fitness